MAQRALYTIPNDRTTHRGGSENIAAWLLGAKPDYLAMIRKLAELDDAPRTERNNFWHGQVNELKSALTVAEDALWLALESGAA